MIPYLKLSLFFRMLKFIKQNRYIPILIIIVLAFILRVYQVNKLPPGLYDDEAAIGYNAYSLLTHGTDEYGIRFPLWFKSFGDYKLPVYIYADIIPISIFGKNAFAVRFPSVFFGTLTVLFLYLFLRNLLSLEYKTLKDKFQNIPLISAFILAIIPWHIQFSRGTYESVVSVCLYMIGCWQFTVFYKNKKIPYLAISLFFFTLASYTYHSFRILTPITILIIFYFLLSKKYLNIKNIFSIALYTSVLHIPWLLFTFGSHGYTRFLQTSTFTQQALPTSTLLQSSIPDFIAYPFIYIKNYLSYFSLQELFAKASDNVRFYSSSEFGFLFRWQLPFLIYGFIVLLREKSKIIKKIVLSILFIVPAAVAIAISPNALHALLLIIPFSIIIAIGIQSIIRHAALWTRIIFIGVILLGIYETSLYFHMYLSHYQNAYAIFWGGAQKKMVEEATNYSKRYYAIVINENFLPNEKIHFLFYNDKLRPLFVDSSWQKPSGWSNKRILYIRYPAAIPTDSKIKLLETITLDTPLKEPVAQFIEL